MGYICPQGVLIHPQGESRVLLQRSHIVCARHGMSFPTILRLTAKTSILPTSTTTFTKYFFLVTSSSSFHILIFELSDECLRNNWKENNQSRLTDITTCPMKKPPYSWVSMHAKYRYLPTQFNWIAFVSPTSIITVKFRSNRAKLCPRAHPEETHT